MSAAAQETDIAWHYDRDELYGDVVPVNYNTLPALRGGNTTTLPLDRSQHWMVWMRPTAASNVRKLYGVIQTKISAGALHRARPALSGNSPPLPKEECIPGKGAVTLCLLADSQYISRELDT